MAAVECAAPEAEGWSPPPLPDDDDDAPGAGTQAASDEEVGWVRRRSLLPEGSRPPFGATAPTGALDPGRYYALRARARNGCGWGPWSLPSSLWRTERA